MSATESLAGNLTDTKASARIDVVVIGAGLMGLYNALQLAKRGLKVVLIDDVAGKPPSFKVGESPFLFTNAFLRTIGEVEPYLQDDASFKKSGVWFVQGAEGASDFSQTTEYAANVDPWKPHYLYDQIKNDKWSRCMYLDTQMVRPDIEEKMSAVVRANQNIQFWDKIRVLDVSFSADLTEVHYAHRSGETGTLSTRWVVDCSGRNRLLARKMRHSKAPDDGFQTTAAWGQFEGIHDGLFDDRWEFEYEDGRKKPKGLLARDRFTLHLWGKHVWVWVIRLSGDRVSVGATWDQNHPPPGLNVREQFWSVIGKFPVLEGVISPERCLEFRNYRSVQYATDTFISEKRYALTGDAGSVVDAYYSQGLCVSLLTSWHIANVIERDVFERKLDRTYIQRINTATVADWKMIRNLVKEKYTSAIGDPRFFVLTHLSDLVIFWAASRTRAKLTRWLVETEGDSAKETSELREFRQELESTLFYSRLPMWNFLPESAVERVQGHVQRSMGERARQRLRAGTSGPALKAIVGLGAPLPALWNLPFVRRSRLGVVDISATDIVESAPTESTKATPGLFGGLTQLERLKWVIRLRGKVLLAAFAAAYAYDWADSWEPRRARSLFVGRKESRGGAARPRDARGPELASERAGSPASAASLRDGAAAMNVGGEVSA